MANWNERMRQIQEEESRKIAADKARAEVEARDKIQQQQSADQRKNDEKATRFNKGRELTKVLERINVQEMLREISQQVWGNLGEIRDSYGTDFNRGTRSVGLYWDFEIDKLVPEKHVKVERRSRVSEPYNEFGGNDREYWHTSTIHMPISLKSVKERKTSALVVYGYTELQGPYDKLPDKTHLYVSDQFGLGGIDGSFGSRNINDHGYGTLVLEDDVKDSQVRVFIEDSFAKSCLYRTQNKLLPFQLKDRVSEVNSAQERRVQENRKSLPWYKR